MKAKIFNIQKFCLHDGSGIRTSVFFHGCNLRCKWCANPECFLKSPGEVAEYDLEALLSEVLKDKAFYDKSGGGVTLTGGEVFMQLNFAKSFCRKLRENGVHVALETAGAVENERFQALAGLADFIYIDCKHYDEKKHIEGTGASNALILENIKWLAGSKKDYCARIPVIPGFNDAVCDARGFCDLFCALGVKSIELLPFHQFGESKYAAAGQSYAFAGVSQLHKEDLKAYYNIFADYKLNAVMQ